MNILEDKEWWKSKTLWSAVAIFGVSVAKYYGLELPYEPIIGLLSALGIWGVRDAIGQNKKD